MATQSQAPLGRSALIALVVFGALLAITIIDYGANKNVSVGIRSLALPTLAADNVTSITLDGKYKALLSKEGDKWMVADPAAAEKKFPADAPSVKRALDALGELDTGAFVTGRAEKHAELEIDDEKGTKATLKTSDGKTLAVVFGRFAKGGGNYVRLQGSDEVFIGKGAFAGTLKKDAEGWRNKKMLDVEADGITAVTVAPAGGTPYTVVAKTEAPPPADPASDAPPPAPKTTWALKAGTALPAGFRIDAAALGRIARSLASLRAASFVDEQKPESESGLGASAAKLTAQVKGGAPMSVSFGATVDGKTYAQVAGNPQLFLVSEYSVKNLTKPLTEHRDLSLFTGVEANQVVSATFKGKGVDVTVKKDDAGAWTYAGKPAAADFDANTVTGKLAGIARMKGNRFIGAQVSAAKLNKGALKLTLTLASGTTQTVTLGGAAPASADGKNTNQVLAQGADGLVYAIAKFQKERYQKPQDLFKAPKPPPGGMPGMGGGGIPGMENLPPEIRKQLEAQMKAGNFPPPGR